MKVLTLKEPWATLIINGYKKYEFRSWKTSYRGKFLIHAGQSIDKDAMERFKYLNLSYFKGEIIGEATITDCIYVDKEFKKKLLQEDKEIYKTSEGYAFVLKDVKKLDKTIPCKGHLSFWNI